MVQGLHQLVMANREAKRTGKTRPDPVREASRTLAEAELQGIQVQALRRCAELSEEEHETKIAELRARRETALAKVAPTMPTTSTGETLGDKLVNTIVNGVLADSQDLRKQNGDLLMRLLDQSRAEGKPLSEEIMEVLKKAGLVDDGRPRLTAVEQLKANVQALVEMSKLWASLQPAAPPTPSAMATADNLSNTIRLEQLRYQNEIDRRRLELEYDDKKEERDFRREDSKFKRDSRDTLLSAARELSDGLALIALGMFGKGGPAAEQAIAGFAQRHEARVSARAEAPKQIQAPCPDCKTLLSIPVGSPEVECPNCHARHEMSWTDEPPTPARPGAAAGAAAPAPAAPAQAATPRAPQGAPPAQARAQEAQDGEDNDTHRD